MDADGKCRTTVRVEGRSQMNDGGVGWGGSGVYAVMMTEKHECGWEGDIPFRLKMFSTPGCACASRNNET